MGRKLTALILLCLAVMICGVAFTGCTVNVTEDYGDVTKTPYDEYYEYYEKYNEDTPGVQSYHTQDLFGREFHISEYFIDLWENSAEVMVGPAYQYMYMENYGLWAEYIENGTDLDVEIGRIIRDTALVNGETVDAYYLMLYGEYDKYELDDEDTEITLYQLTDDYLKRSLTEFYDDLYEDDFSGSVYPPNGVLMIYVIVLILFLLLPIAGIVAAVIFTVRKRPGAPYRSVLIILCVSLAIIVLGFTVTVFLML